MRIYNGRIILPGLGAFLLIATMPMWHGAVAPPPAFQSATNPQHEQCIEPKAVMRADHMRLLSDWRAEVVRNGDRTYTASDGRKWEKSLNRTCMSCHGKADTAGRTIGAATNCTQCHNQQGVQLECWTCHVDPTAKGAL